MISELKLQRYDYRKYFSMNIETQFFYFFAFSLINLTFSFEKNITFTFLLT